MDLLLQKLTISALKIGAVKSVQVNTSPKMLSYIQRIIRIYGFMTQIYEFMQQQHGQMTCVWTHTKGTKLPDSVDFKRVFRYKWAPLLCEGRQTLRQDTCCLFALQRHYEMKYQH